MVKSGKIPSFVGFLLFAQPRNTEACVEGNYSTVQLLLEAKVQINIANWEMDGNGSFIDDLAAEFSYI